MAHKALRTHLVGLLGRTSSGSRWDGSRGELLDTPEAEAKTKRPPRHETSPHKEPKSRADERRGGQREKGGILGSGRAFGVTVSKSLLVSLPACFLARLPACLLARLSPCPVCFLACLSACPFVYLPVCLLACLSPCPHNLSFIYICLLDAYGCSIDQNYGNDSLSQRTIYRTYPYRRTRRVCRRRLPCLDLSDDLHRPLGAA